MELALKDCYQFEIQQACNIISGKIVMPTNKRDVFARGLSFDSREITSGQIFLARRGEHVDGHNYILDAFKNGAAFAIVESKNFDANDQELVNYPLIIVENSEIALEDLAKFVVSKYEGRKIAITGSLGKTSLKNLLFLIFNNKNYYQQPIENQAYCARGSYNNLFGVCWSVINMPLKAKFAIFEVGMNSRFEILRLAKIIKPSLVVITNVSNSHIGYLGSYLEIVKAKGEILEKLNDEAMVVLPRGDTKNDKLAYEYFSKIIANKNVTLLSFGKSMKADIKVGQTKTTLINNKVASLVEIIENNQTTSGCVYVVGEHWGYIITAAYASVKLLRPELKAKDFLKLIINLVPMEGRGRIIYGSGKLNNNIIIDDSYNASALSIKNTIKSLLAISKCYEEILKYNKVIILGDMLELGKFSKKIHQSLANEIILAKVDQVILIGTYMQFLSHELIKKCYHSVYYFDKLNKAQARINNIITKNSIVSIKGANALNLHTLIPTIKKININNK